MKGSVEGMAYPHTQTSRLAWLTQKTAGNWRRDDWQKTGLTKGFCSQPGGRAFPSVEWSHRFLEQKGPYRNLVDKEPRLRWRLN